MVNTAGFSSSVDKIINVLGVCQEGQFQCSTGICVESEWFTMQSPIEVDVHLPVLRTFPLEEPVSIVCKATQQSVLCYFRPILSINDLQHLKMTSVSSVQLKSCAFSLKVPVLRTLTETIPKGGADLMTRMLF